MQFKTVRILKESLKTMKPHVFAKENVGTQLVACLPAHENVLKQEMIAPGVSISNLYDIVHSKITQTQRSSAKMHYNVCWKHW